MENDKGTSREGLPKVDPHKEEIKKVIGAKYLVFELPVAGPIAEMLLEYQIRIVQAYVESAQVKLSKHAVTKEDLPKRKYMLKYSLVELKG